MYGKLITGSKYTPNYKVYITKDSQPISAWHQINPFNESDIITCVNEIPRFSNAKFELSKKDPLNPIVQDIKNNKPRFVQNIFPLKGYPWNYGFIPQTYEDPDEEDKHCKAKGDNDPLDIIEIGSKSKKIGQVYKAKVLGCLALLDGGECDWKIIVVDCEDELAQVENIENLDVKCPGLLEMTIKWFRDYKIPDGKGKNEFGLEGKFMGKEFAMQVIKEANESYKKMTAEKRKDIWIEGEVKIEGGEEKEGQEPESIGGYYFVKHE